MLNDPLFIVAAIACFLVLFVLLAGIATFTKGGAFNHKYGNKLMRYRIYAQFGAVVLILAFVLLRQGG